MLSNNEDLIAVIGATGQQGGAVVRALQASGQFKVRTDSQSGQASRPCRGNRRGRFRPLEAATGTVVHSIETGSPLQVVPDGNRAWVSNVQVPPSMSPRNAQPRLGGIVLLDLTTFTTTAVAQVPDASGIAVTSVSSSFARNACSSAGNAVD